MRIRMSAIAVAAGLVLIPATAAVGDNLSPEEKKVQVCHATGSESNPFVLIEIAESALKGHFRDGHEEADDVVGEGAEEACAKTPSPDPTTSTPTPSTTTSTPSPTTSVPTPSTTVPTPTRTVIADPPPPPAPIVDGYEEDEWDCKRGIVTHYKVTFTTWPELDGVKWYYPDEPQDVDQKVTTSPASAEDCPKEQPSSTPTSTPSSHPSKSSRAPSAAAPVTTNSTAPVASATPTLAYTGMNWTLFWLALGLIGLGVPMVLFARRSRQH